MNPSSGPAGDLEIIDDDPALAEIILRAVTGDEHAWLELCQDVELAVSDLLGTGEFFDGLGQRDSERKAILADVTSRLREQNFTRLKLFIASRETPHAPKFSTWIRIVARRGGLDYLRALAGDTMSGRASGTTRSTQRLMEGAAGLIEDPALSALELWIDGASHTEIARELGTSGARETHDLVESALETLRASLEAPGCVPRCSDVFELSSSAARRDDLCGRCKAMLELFAQREAIIVDTQRRGECARFEILIANLPHSSARELAVHRDACADCRAAFAVIDADHSDSARAVVTGGRHYLLGREVARGGMGRILQATDLRIDRPVAVKELLENHPALAARFEREARVTARLQHPGIVPIYEIGRWSDGTPFYVMRMVEGQTLKEAVRDKTSLEQRLALLPSVIAAADAVAFAHARRVIHRDLTPNNVLVGDHGETVVIDWGLAKDLGDASEEDLPAGPYRDEAPHGLTVAGAVIGTAAYMPPEQARGETVDERADVYALGALLYHLLAGAAPYQAETTAEVLRLVQAGRAVDLVALGETAPRDLVSIIAKAMSSDPADRYANAGALVEELRRFQTGRIVEAHAYSPAERIRRWIRSHRSLVVGAVVGLGAVLITGTIAIAGIVRERNRAEDATAFLLEESGRQELAAGNPVRAAVWLSAAYSAGNARPSLRLLLGRAMRDVEALEGTHSCGGEINMLALRPDKSHVAASCKSSVRIWRIEDGEPLATLSAPGATFEGVTFSSDGGRLLTWGDDGIARLWDATSYQLQATLPGHLGKIMFAELSPDGRDVLTSGADGTVRVWDAGSATARVTIIAALPMTPVRAIFVGDQIVSTSGVEMKVWDRSGAVVRTMSNGTMIVNADLAQRSKESGIVCGVDGSVRMWNIATGTLVKELAGHSDMVWTCVLSTDATRLLTTSSDGTATIWDTTTGRLIRTLRPGGVVSAGVFAGDDKLVVTGGLGGGIKVWEIASGALLGSDDTANAHQARLLAAGDRIIAADENKLRIWRGLGTRNMHTFQPPSGSAVRANADGSRVLVQSADGSLAIWDPITNQPVPHVVLRQPGISTSTKVAATTAGGVTIIDFTTGATVKEVTVAGEVRQVDLSESGSTLMVTTADGLTVVSDVATGAELKRWPREWRVGLLSSDGTRVLAVGPMLPWQPLRAEAWRLSPVHRIANVPIGRNVVRQGEFVADSRLLLTTGTALAGATLLWDLDQDRALALIPGALSAQANRDGSAIAFRSPDQLEVRTSNGARGWSIPLPAGVASQIDLSPEGSLIALTQSTASTFQIHDATDGRVLLASSMPRGASMTMGGFSLETVYTAFSRDGEHVTYFPQGMAVTVDLGLERRPPWDVARIVASRAPASLAGTRLRTTPDPVARLRGRVVHEGRPVRGANMTLTLAGNIVVSMESDANGSFELTELPPGSVEIDGLSPEHGAFARPARFELVAGENMIEIDLNLAGTISGAIVDAQGTPLRGIEVRAQCDSQSDGGAAVTDRAGMFSISALSGGGDYKLSFLHNGAPVAAAPERSVHVADGKSKARLETIRLPLP